MENLKIAGFRDQLIQAISNNGLPVGTSLFILKDIVTEIEKLYKEVTEKEYSNYIAEQQKKADEAKEQNSANEQDNQG